MLLSRYTHDRYRLRIIIAAIRHAVVSPMTSHGVQSISFIHSQFVYQLSHAIPAVTPIERYMEKKKDSVTDFISDISLGVLYGPSN